jgi:hypothetical protein
MTKMKYNLDDLDKVKKNITRIQPTVLEAGEKAIGEIIGNWSSGKGGNNKSMKALTEKYKTRKRNSGRSGKRDLNWTGDLYRSFIVKKEGKSSAKLTFTSDAMGKAKGNYKLDNNMMKVSKKIKEMVLSIIHKGVWK